MLTFTGYKNAFLSVESKTYVLKILTYIFHMLRVITILNLVVNEHKILSSKIQMVLLSSGFRPGKGFCSVLRAEFIKSFQSKHFFPNAIMKGICRAQVGHHLYGGQARPFAKMKLSIFCWKCLSTCEPKTKISIQIANFYVHED